MNRSTLWFLLLALSLTAAAMAQPSDPLNFSGLRDRTLTKQQSGDLVGDLTGAVLGGDRSSVDPKDVLRGILGSASTGSGETAAPRGTIVSARVLEDRDRSLVVEIAYRGVDASAPKILVAEVRDRKNKAQQIASDAPAIPSAEGTVTLRLRVADGVAEGTTLESKSLALRIATGANALRNDAIATFALPKQWAVPVRPENVVVDVTPTPVGTIPPSDPAAGTPPVKPQIFRPEVLQLITTKVTLAPNAIHLAQPVASPKYKADKSVKLERFEQPAVQHVDLSAIATLAKIPPPQQTQGVPDEVKNAGGLGPSRERLPIFATIQAAPGVTLTPEVVTNLHPDLFRDANPRSGIFYYAPAAYNLAWDKDTGYALRMVYGTASDAAGRVAVGAQLTSGVNSSELDLLRNLLRAALGSEFKELRPLPHAGAPSVAMRELGHYDIPPDKVAVTGLPYIGGPAELSFVTDAVTKENIEAALTSGLGINGTVTFTGAVEGSTGAFNLDVPLHLDIASPRTFGVAYWNRGTAFRNETPFPLRLRYLHFLTIGREGVPTVYSYALGNTQVLPRSRAQLADANIAPWLTAPGKALRAWIDYAVVSDYPEGTQLARNQWTRGAGEAAGGKLTIASLRPFADSAGLARIIVDLRSRYFDSRAQNVETRSVTLTRDDQSVEVGPFYAPSGGGGGPLFEYTLRIVKADGTTAGPTAPAGATTADLFVGSSQLRALLDTH